MQGKVEICGVNTSRLHVLSQVEMDALLRRAQAGDEDARENSLKEICGWFSVSYSALTSGAKTPTICFR